jgi:putative ABC transport system substrate-binding protein
MNRRTFLGTLAGALLAAPLAAEAQQAGTAYHIGVIDPGPPKFKREAGYVVGQNLDFEFRHVDRQGKLQAYAEELVRLGVDLIVTGGTPPTQAAKQATSTIPVVFYNVGDPVGSRLVATLSRRLLRVAQGDDEGASRRQAPVER